MKGLLVGLLWKGLSRIWEGLDMKGLGRIWEGLGRIWWDRWVYGWDCRDKIVL